MTPPAWFVSALSREFRDRLRVRWSHQDHTWQIEQHVGRASMPAHKVDPEDDRAIRRKDGYAFVLSVAPGDRLPCPRCGETLKLPVREFRETACKHCARPGNDVAKVRACYWPLSDSLIDHLKKLDPERAGARTAVKEVDAANKARAISADRALGNHIEAATKDMLPTIGGFSPIGYTGKERYQ